MKALPHDGKNSGPEGTGRPIDLPKDLNDILELTRRNPREVDPGSLREVCDKYGPAGIFDKIQTLLE